MPLSILDDKSKTPTKKQLADVLGRTHATWDKLRDYLASECAPLTEKWGFPGKNYGWSLQLKQKKRTVLYMTPQDRHFLVAVVLGDKAVAAAHENKLSADILKKIDSAKKYVEGRGIRIEIRRAAVLAVVKKLAAIKVAN